MNLSMKMFFTLVLFILLLTTHAAFAGKVYKWVDKNGDVHYGAQPPAENAQELNIKIKPASSASETEADSAGTGNDDENGEKAKANEAVKVHNEKELAEVEKKNTEIRKKNCGISKKRLAAINAGGRLYEVNEKGERSYWNDATRQAKMAEAQAQVDEWCK